MILKSCILQVQLQCIPTKRKSRKKTERPAWVDKELLEKPKQLVYRGCKLEKIVWEEEHTEIVQ